MPRSFTATAALCAALTLAAPLLAQAQETNARVIVQFKADSGLLRKQALAGNERHASQALALGQRVGLALSAGAGAGERSQVVFARGMSSQALAERLARESDVEFAVPDRRKRIVAAPNDPLYATGGVAGPAVGQWYLRAPSSTPGTVMAAINAEAAWDITTGSSSIVVAVLDSGIRSDHPDLAGQVIAGYDMVADVPTANDGNGRDADPSDPGDWLDAADIASGNFSGPGGCTSADIADSSWHGTQTAGLIGALTNNAIGMASVGRAVRILPVRVLGKCGGFDIDILAGMRWAAGISVPGVPDNPNPAKVISMSLGGGSTCTAAYVSAVNEILARGVTIVASAGNGSGHAVSEPASCAGVIGVAGLRHIGSKVGYSDLGPQVSISAPAGNCVNETGACLYPILTTTNSGITTPAGSTYSNATNISIGTSFSAPLVAGTAALMLSANSSMAPADVRTLLRTTARPFPISGSDALAPVPACVAPSGTDQIECYCTTTTCGAGMLDAAAAVAAATGLLASIEATPSSPVVGAVVALSATQSTAPSGRAITSYAWSIGDSGGTGATLSAASGATTSVSTTAAGRFTVTLTITDGVATTSSTRAVDVSATPPPSGGGEGGGGGALGLGWLFALVGAVVALGISRRRSRSG